MIRRTQYFFCLKTESLNPTPSPVNIFGPKGVSLIKLHFPHTGTLTLTHNLISTKLIKCGVIRAYLRLGPDSIPVSLGLALWKKKKKEVKFYNFFKKIILFWPVGKQNMISQIRVTVIQCNHGSWTETVINSVASVRTYGMSHRKSAKWLAGTRCFNLLYVVDINLGGEAPYVFFWI